MVYHIRKTAFTLAEGATHVALLDNYRKNAFTLAEVLITLGVIGIVAAMTLPSLLTNIQNKGYVEALKKTYSVLQEATTSIVYEEGSPDTWSWTSNLDSDNSGNQYILDLYRNHLNLYCSGNKYTYYDDETFCNGIKIPDYSDLSGKESGKGLYGAPLFIYGYPFVLNDGTIVAIHFMSKSGQVYWGTPVLSFVVDVNGVKGPNKLGRDVFFLYMNKDMSGKILPYTNEIFLSTGTDHRDTCDKDKAGYSCAYRVITEGKMNY